MFPRLGCSGTEKNRSVLNNSSSLICRHLLTARLGNILGLYVNQLFLLKLFVCEDSKSLPQSMALFTLQP